MYQLKLAVLHILVENHFLTHFNSPSFKWITWLLFEITADYSSEDWSGLCKSTLNSISPSVYSNDLKYLDETFIWSVGFSC